MAGVLPNPVVTPTFALAIASKLTPQSRRSSRLKSSYVGDKFAACAVLVTLFKPTKREPFRSHTLKWLEGDHPYIFRPIVKNRDFVFMEATGFTQLAD
ncbi:hypothetical protein PHYBOEH_002618, partial [Phytophthora boehmeriae]